MNLPQLLSCLQPTVPTHMIRCGLLLAGLGAALPSSGAENARTPPTIATIDFFGLRTVPIATVEAHLNLKEGDPFDRAQAMAAADELKKLPGIGVALLTQVPTDRGDQVHVFVGVEEKTARRIAFRPAPTGEDRLADELTAIYQAWIRAAGWMLRSGDSPLDISQGHALHPRPAVRKAQDEALAVVPNHLPELKKVLASSSTANDRIAAAWLLGYAPDKKAVLEDLLHAARDRNPGVRNNAMGTLGPIASLAIKNPALGIRVPADFFIEVLGSANWSDRRQASAILVELTASRDADLLRTLREGALPELIEMVRWKSTRHALPALRLLGRVAGWDDEKIATACREERREEVIAAVSALK